MLYLVCGLMAFVIVQTVLLALLLWRAHQIEAAVDIVADALLDIGSSVAETHKGNKKNDN